MEASGPTTVLTIGYTGRTLPGLVTELHEHGVATVVDVRAVAESSIDGFSGDELTTALHQADIGYVHLGALGDLEPQPYEQYMATPAFTRAFDELVRTVGQQRSCLLCACEAIATCHVRFIAHALRSAGFRVVHLTPAGPTEALTFEA